MSSNGEPGLGPAARASQRKMGLPARGIVVRNMSLKGYTCVPLSLFCGFCRDHVANFSMSYVTTQMMLDFFMH